MRVVSVLKGLCFSSSHANVVGLCGTEDEVWLALSQVEDGHSKYTISPGKPGPCVLGDIVDIYTLVDEAFEGRAKYHVDALHYLVVVVRCLGLDQQAHGPGGLQANMGACRYMLEILCTVATCNCRGLCTCLQCP